MNSLILPLQKYLSITIVLLLFLLCLPLICFSQRSQDSLSLVALYNSTDGPNWTNTWDLGQPMDTWFGIKLNAEGRVQEITQHSGDDIFFPFLFNDGNNLNGILPEELWTLTELKVLDLTSNFISGTLSPSIGNLKKLESLSITNYLITNGGLTGTIPASIGDILPLRNLMLSDNQLTGTLPISLGNLVNLDFLGLENNSLTGSLPNLSQLQQLRTMRISGNAFTGDFPNWITQLLNLEIVFAGTNSFTGSIPDDIGNLSQLGTLILRNNNLSGTIPTSIGKLSNLFILLLDGNQLIDSIPQEITNLNIGRFWVNNNQLSGVIPDFSRSDRLYDINVSNNNFTFQDIIPNANSITAKAKDDSFRAGDYNYTPQRYSSSNQIVNPNIGDNYTIDLDIDEGLSSNVYVWFKDGQFYTRMVGNNQLVFPNITANDAGVYHCEITNPNAPDLTIRSHNITIQIQSTVCSSDSLALVAIYKATNGPNWTNTWDLSQPVRMWYGVTLNAQGCVTQLRLVEDDSRCFGCSFGGNNVVGNLPNDIWDLSELIKLDLTGNRDMRYTLPSDIDKLVNIEALALHRSGLMDPIPNAIGNLSKLERLEISGNGLSGALPSTLNNLTELKSFIAYANRLDNFPNLGNLQKLEAINVSGNGFSGPLPSWINDLPNIVGFDLSHNNYSGDLTSINWNKLQKLRNIILRDNSLSGSIPAEIGNLPLLNGIDFSDNQLSGLLPVSFSTSPMEYLRLDDNLLSGQIPDFSQSSELEVFDLRNNLFTFSDIGNLANVLETKPLDASPFENGFGYIPQKNYAIEKTYNLELGVVSTVEIDMQDWLNIPMSYSSDNYATTLSPFNIYSWFKDGQFISTVTVNGSNISLPIRGPVQLSEAGVYVLQITNPNVPNLTLISHQITIEITEPIDPKQQLFDDFAWLHFITSLDNCTNETITIYQAGTFQYVYVTNDLGSRLFNEQGNLYCTSTLNYDCIVAYNLSEIVVNWSCQETDTNTPTEEEIPTDTGGTTNSDNTIFENFSWLGMLVNANNCSNEEFEVYQSGTYQYVYVTTEEGSKLYNASGQLYCTGAANYDCLAAYNLTNKIGSWSCQETNTNTPNDTEEEPMDTDNNSSDNTIFDSYPWLTEVIDLTNCSSEEINVYQTGPHEYLYITNEDGSTLYAANGQFYCSSTPTYDCLAAYNLTNLIASWKCGSGASTSEESNEESNTNTTSLFTDYSWLGGIMDANNCNDQKITVYQTGVYQYLYIESEGSRVLYNQNGQLYCTSSSNYNCLTAYGLTAIIDSWSCQSFSTPSITYKSAAFPSTETMTVYPNPARDKLHIEIAPTVLPQNIRLIDVTGKVLFFTILDSPLTTIDISDLKSGVYFIQKKTAKGSQTVRVVIQ